MYNCIVRRLYLKYLLQSQITALVSNFIRVSHSKDLPTLTTS